ncbi:uncharacterized protein LOC129946079 isoform X1 [Eupeodes corollae]|uniref:uncharacterized protein LOC129946079 isoform X1 n=1 Tax=Eupeodes corollae TaxID=290404 RepID=UPI0024901C85|nr:uncharacterized protein LOC129946079 isoform X1 [Eupeodes corollae]
MVLLFNFLIATALFTAVLGQSYPANLKASNGTDDYFKIAQAELLVKIKISELENDAIDARFLDRLAVIEQQQLQVLNETQQVNQTLIPLQALNFARKICIQTYDSQFITYESGKEQFGECLKRAENAGYSLTASARSQTKAARSFATFTLPYNLKNYCTGSSYNYNQTKIEDCYIRYVSVATQTVQDNLQRAEVFRQQSIFEMNAISMTAVQCSYKIEKAVLQSLTATLKKIDDCVDSLHKKTSMVGDAKALN